MNFDTWPATSPDQWGSFSCAIFDIDMHRDWMLGTCKCLIKLYELFTYTCIAHVHFAFNALCTWLPINAPPPPPPPLQNIAVVHQMIAMHCQVSWQTALNSLNAECIYTYMRELSVSPFMQCCVLCCVDQNHFEYHCRCMEVQYWHACNPIVIQICGPGVSTFCVFIITRWHLLLQ